MIAFTFMILLYVYLPLTVNQSKPKIYYAMAAPSQNTVNLESDQSFSGSEGAIIEYNIYIENKGKSPATFALSASSNMGYYIEIWRDTNQIGGGDLQIIPPWGSTITLSSSEVATLIVKVMIPSDAIDGDVDNTIVRALDTASGASDSVTIATTVDSALPYPSNWIQLGSDHNFPSSTPDMIDAKAFYYNNDGIEVFFRMAEANRPNTKAFLYSVYLDTKAGGQQIDSYYYDYLLCSDGALYEWDGTSWSSSGSSTYFQVDGTSIVLWSNLDNFILDSQDIHLLASVSTKSVILKDKIGPCTISRSSISELPFVLIPLLGAAIYFAISKRHKKAYLHS